MTDIYYSTKKYWLSSFVVAMALIALSASNFMPLLQFVAFGSPLIPNAAFKLLFFMFMLVYFLYSSVLDKSGMKIFPASYLSLFLLFFGYLIVNLWIKAYEYPVGYVVFGYNAYYSFLFFLVFCVYLKINDALVARFLVAVSIPLMILGVAQFALNSHLVADFSNSFIRSHAVGFYGRTRAVSLFDGSVNYGHFLCLLLPLFLFCFFRSNEFFKKLFFASLFVFGVFAVFTTLTRATFLEAAMVAFFSFLLHKWKGTGKAWMLRYFPVLFGMAAVVFAYGGALIQTGSSNDLMSNESLLIRLAEWKMYFPVWVRDIDTFLFGYGVYQNENFSYSSGVIIDNVFLAIGYHIGFFGLLLWLLLTWSIWSWLLRLIESDDRNPILFSVVSVWSAFIATGVFSLSMWMYPLFAMVAFPSSFSKKC